MDTESAKFQNKPVIGKWLEDDKKHWRKQHHTAKRVYDRLVGEYGYSGGYFTDDQMAAAMIDRLVHHGHLLIFEGRSYRMEHALMRQEV